MTPTGKAPFREHLFKASKWIFIILCIFFQSIELSNASESTMENELHWNKFRLPPHVAGALEASPKMTGIVWSSRDVSARCRSDSGYESSLTGVVYSEDISLRLRSEVWCECSNVWPLVQAVMGRRPLSPSQTPQCRGRESPCRPPAPAPPRPPPPPSPRADWAVWRWAAAWGTWTQSTLCSLQSSLSLTSCLQSARPLSGGSEGWCRSAPPGWDWPEWTRHWCRGPGRCPGRRVEGWAPAGPWTASRRPRRGWLWAWAVLARSSSGRRPSTGRHNTSASCRQRNTDGGIWSSSQTGRYRADQMIWFSPEDPWGRLSSVKTWSITPARRQEHHHWTA